MAFTSVLVLGPTGGFGQFIVPELVRRKSSFTRIGAYSDESRPLSSEKSYILESYAKQGVEIVKGSPKDPIPFKGKLVARIKTVQLILMRF
jgi:hypothetical protein